MSGIPRKLLGSLSRNGVSQGCSGVGVARELLGDYSGVARELRCSCSGVELELLGSCSGVALELLGGYSGAEL